QAEDGIRDFHVTGVQTCALPISAPESLSDLLDAGAWQHQAVLLMGADYHTAWANQAMREKAGIDAAYVQSLPAKSQHTIGVASKIGRASWRERVQIVKCSIEETI